MTVFGDNVINIALKLQKYFLSHHYFLIEANKVVEVKIAE